MNVNSSKPLDVSQEANTTLTTVPNADDPPNCDNSEISTLNGDQANKSALRKDSLSKLSSKRVKIVDPGPALDLESDDEDSLSQHGTLERAAAVSTGESTITITLGQSVDPQAAAVDRKKTKEERKKEREKKKEEEMLKKYQAEQEAKQKVSAKSKCGRWIKHNLKIGEGGYKFVYRGYDTVESRNVAWCEFKREHVDTKEKRQAMFKETEIMLKMNHPHIVRCFDVFREWIDMEDPNNQIEEKGVVIIQELMGEGTLKSVIRKNFLEGQCILKFPLITRWWHQILDALRYMHHKIQPPILHRDLKADNCFLYGASDEEYLNVKVGDFGLATHVNNSGRKTMLGTLGFMAPEIFDEKYDEKVDIYAFGMLMLEVMTNRTPYDECETVIQVAAKTMSGQGPDIMGKILNPSLREVISACIQPLTCFRPTAEELYFHPLFQRYQEGDDSWPKTLPVEVEPNYDNATDRAEVLDRFVRSLDNAETRNPNFNLRLRFRDKKMLQELGLDDGESLEFDLDIYKAEDQDIPDLIHSLRLGYEDKLWRVFENPKQPDKKIVSSHLDKLFSSIRLQMQFLVKMLLGKRWKAILDSLVDEERTKKKQEGAPGADEDDDSDTDAREASSFTIIGKYKTKWIRAKRLLEREIQAYRNRTPVNTGVAQVPTPGITSMNPASGASTITSTAQSESIAQCSTLTSSVVSTIVSQLPRPLPAQPNAPITVEPTLLPDTSEPIPTVHVATVGKFSITTPSVAVPSSVTPVAVTIHSASTPPLDGTARPSVTQHLGLRPQATDGSAFFLQPPSQPDASYSHNLLSVQDSSIPAVRPPTDSCAGPALSATSSKTGLGVYQATVSPLMTAVQPSQQPSVAFPSASHDASATKPESEAVATPPSTRSIAQSTMLLQQLMQTLAAILPKSTAAGLPEPLQSSSQQQQQHPMLVPAAAIATTVEQVAANATSGVVQTAHPPATTNAVHFTPQDLALLHSHLLSAGLMSGTPSGQLPKLFSEQPAEAAISHPHTSTPMLDMQGPTVTSAQYRQQSSTSSTSGPVDTDLAARTEPQSVHQSELPQSAILLSQVIEALLSTAFPGSSLSPASTGGVPGYSSSQAATQSIQQPVSSQLPPAFPFTAPPKLHDTSYALTNKDIERIVLQLLETLRADSAAAKTAISAVGPTSAPTDSGALSIHPTSSEVLVATRSSQTSMVDNYRTGEDETTPVPHFVGAIPTPPLSESPHLKTHQFTAGNPSDNTTSADTMRCEEDFSEASRPISPSDGPTPAYLPVDTHVQPLGGPAPSLTTKSSLAGSTPPYFTASSCSNTLPPLHLPTTVLSSPVSGPALHDPSPEKQSLALGLDYIHKLLSSLSLLPLDRFGVTGIVHQPELEEVAPLLPPISGTSLLSHMSLNDSVAQIAANTVEPSAVRGDVTPYQLSENNPLLLSQLSQSSSREQGTRPFSTVPYPYSPASDATVSLTCTIPSSLEVVIREVISKLCYYSHRPILLLPTPYASDISVATSPFRVLEVPSEHIFLGVPNSRDPANPFNVTTFVASNGPVFITIDDGPPEGNRSLVPRVFQTPIDTAVVLSPDGGVHRVNKPALVVPVQPSETRKTCSPPLSPNSEVTDGARLGQQFDSSIQIRELPIHPNMDTLTLDDVLNLLLALRSASQQYPASVNTSPTSDTYTMPNLPTHVESRSISCATSRRSSAFGSQHSTQNLPSHLTHPASVFAQLPQSSSSRLPRGPPSDQQSVTRATLSSMAPIRTFSEQLHSQTQPLAGAIPFIHPSASSNPTIDAVNAIEPALINRPPVSTREVTSVSGVHSQSTPPVSAQLLLRLLHDYLASLHSPSHTSSSQAISTEQPLHHQTVSDLSSLNSVTAQQLFQLVSTLNSPNNVEQVPSVQPQLTRQPSVQCPAPAVAPSSSRPSGHGSSRPSFFVQPAVSQISSTGLPTPSATIPTPVPCQANVPLLTSLLGRLLSQSFVPIADTLPDAPRAVPSVSPAAPFYPSQTSLTRADASGAGGMIGSDWQVLQRSSPPPPPPQYMKPPPPPPPQQSLVAEQIPPLQSSQSLTRSTAQHQLIPELLHALFTLHKQAEVGSSRDPPTTLPLEIQRILSTIQSCTNLPTHPVSGVATPHSVAAPTHSVPVSIGPPPVPSSVTCPVPCLAATIPHSITGTVNSVPSALAAVSQTYPGAPSHALDSLWAFQVDPHPPMIAHALQPVPATRNSSTKTTTVASKFTVVPVKCDNDEPPPPSVAFLSAAQPQTTAFVPQSQAPPIPPRQRSHPIQPLPATCPTAAVVFDSRGSVASSLLVVQPNPDPLSTHWITRLP
ncbi:unnamed protein product [Dicrocoelium dendriticum]|nr:unnamed protein product [Dicrocoelium dendriticum]